MSVRLVNMIQRQIAKTIEKAVRPYRKKITKVVEKWKESNSEIVNIYNNKNHIKMSITSGFKGKTAKKALRLLDNKYDGLEKAIQKVEFEGRDKLIGQLKKQYEKEKIQLISDIAAGKVKDEAPAKKAAPAKKKAPVKKAAPTKKKKTAPAPEPDEDDIEL